MDDSETTESELLNQLAELRRRIAELEVGSVERKPVEERLRLQAQLLDSVQESIVATDLEGRVIYWSKGAEALVGYSAEETIGKPITKFARPSVETNQESLRQVLKTGTWHEQAWRQRKDGSWYYADSSIALIRDDNGVPVGMMGIERDITDQFQAQTALRESEERYRTLLETISDYAYIYRIEPDNRAVLEWLTEDSFIRLTGYTRLELEKYAQSILLHPDDKPFLERQIQEIGQGKSVQGEYRLITKSGQLRWVLISRKPIWDEQENRVVRVYGVVQDITEQKQAEEALAQERNLLRTLIDHIPDDIYVKDRQSRFLLNNAASLHSLGVARQEDLLGKTDLDFFPREVAESWIAEEQMVMQTGQPVLDEEAFLPWHTDRRCWVTGSVIPFHDAKGEVIGVVGISRDITQSKRDEQALRASEAKFRSIFEHASDGMRLVDHNGIILDWNSASEQITGLSREQVVGQPIVEVLFQLLPREQRSPDRYESMKRASAQMLYTHLEPRLRQTTIERPDGVQRLVEEEVTPIEVEGKIILCGIIRDVTEREQAEQHRLALALEKKRGEMLGTLTAQLAHDFKTPLTTINTSLYLLERYTDPGQRQQKIDNIKEQVRKLASFVQDIMVLPHLDREPELQLTPVALNDLIKDIGDEFHPLVERARLKLTLQLADDLPRVVADSMNIRRAITNLVENAVNYTPEGGTVTVRTYQQNSAVLVEVTDTGIGINEADMEHIFERFYRSTQAQKISGSGSGLGLVIVKRIVEMHGGSVEVESEPGEGSTFRIRLPL